MGGELEAHPVEGPIVGLVARGRSARLLPEALSGAVDEALRSRKRVVEASAARNAGRTVLSVLSEMMAATPGSVRQSSSTVRNTSWRTRLPDRRRPIGETLRKIVPR